MLLPLLSQTEHCHAASFSRHGGVSLAPYHSLNVGLHVGDDASAVSANRWRIKEHLGVKRLVSARQVHGDRVLLIEDMPASDLEHEGYDALVTALPGLGLMIQQADCQAVVLHDPRQHAIGNLHAGWRGSVANIIGTTVTAMSEAFGSRPADLLAAISPSLGPCCAEFVNFREELPPHFHRYQIRANHFDFWSISRDQLTAAGLLPENIQIASVCTKCSPDYFSHRREKITGRFATVVALR
ncbi:MAG: peptidoglycan editing factor PgeF [Thermodesulfobacteriota bacterium]